MKSMLQSTLILWVISPFLFALTVSSSGEEVNYQYETHFRSLIQVKNPSKKALEDSAEFHAAHLFGIFHSPEVSEQNGYPAELIEGFAGTKVPTVLSVESFEMGGDSYQWVRYAARGTMVVHKAVLDHWLGNSKSGKVTLPLLLNLPAIYQDDLKGYRLSSGETQKSSKWTNCTDTHYWESKDFSYFYTPYRCEELRTSPISEDVHFNVERVVPDVTDVVHRVPIQEISGPNENGRLKTFYFVSGFDEPDAEEIHLDAGWKSFKFIERTLVRKHGFSRVSDPGELRELVGDSWSELNLLMPVKLAHDSQRRYINTFFKKEGDNLLVARSGLFNTEFESRGSPRRSFPKFWKEAWENGDVIYFGGHSGDGESLNLKNLISSLDTADIDSILFNQKKTQVAMVDSCSSYAWYQDIYKAHNPKLHLVTFGLVSLFHLATATIEEFLDITTGLDEGQSWEDAIHQIEDGQLVSHINYFYKPRDRKRKLLEFRQKSQVPTSLMNVWLHD